MQHRINHLKDHYIVCGLGRVGQQVAKELSNEDEPFIVIDRDEAQLAMAKDQHWPHIIGDVALDESLFEKAHIATAKAVIVAVGTDADAIFMAVSARALQKDIFIVARASNVEAADKMSKIGVNRVALPYQIGGYHMATMALRPTVVDFLNLLIDQDKSELSMEEFLISDGGIYDKKPLKELEQREGLAILAIRRENGQSIINPTDTTILNGNDRLIVMGSKEQIEVLDKHLRKVQEKTGAKATTSQPLDIQPSPFLKEE